MYYDAFSSNVQQVLDIATLLAKRYRCRYVGSEHILFGLMNANDGRAASILRESGATNERFLYFFEKTIDLHTIIPGNMFTARTKQLLQRSIDFSLKARSGFVGTEHLLLALLADDDSVAVSILRHMKVNVDKMLDDLETALFGKYEEEDDEDESEVDSIFAKTFGQQKPKPKRHRRLL